MGLVLGIAMKIYTNVANGLKLKAIKFWWLVPTFVEITGEKPVRGPTLNRVKTYMCDHLSVND